jgi:protein phosphatase
VVAVVVLALLVGGGIGTYAWALQHWFVGVSEAGDSEQVGVFRGVNTSILGLDLYRLDEETPLAVGDLNSVARSRVSRGIPADDAADADQIVDRLRDERLPPCGTPATSTDGSAPPAATESTPTETSESPATAGPSSSASRGASFPAPEPAATGSALPTGTDVPTDSSAGLPGSETPTTSASETTPAGEPGVDCREEE